MSVLIQKKCIDLKQCRKILAHILHSGRLFHCIHKKPDSLFQACPAVKFFQIACSQTVLQDRICSNKALIFPFEVLTYRNHSFQTMNLSRIDPVICYGDSRQPSRICEIAQNFTGNGFSQRLKTATVCLIPEIFLRIEPFFLISARSRHHNPVVGMQRQIISSHL